MQAAGVCRPSNEQQEKEIQNYVQMNTDYIHVNSSTTSRVCARAYVWLCVCVGVLQGGLRGEPVSGAKGSTEK